MRELLRNAEGHYKLQAGGRPREILEQVSRGCEEVCLYYSTAEKMRHEHMVLKSQARKASKTRSGLINVNSDCILHHRVAGGWTYVTLHLYIHIYCIYIFLFKLLIEPTNECLLTSHAHNYYYSQDTLRLHCHSSYKVIFSVTLYQNHLTIHTVHARCSV